MKIEYFGHSYFRISGNDYSISLDPFSNIGLREEKTKSDYLFTSHKHYDHANESIVEYKKKITTSDNIFTIISTKHDEKGGSLRGENSVLLFNLDGYKVAFLGDLGESDSQILINKLQGVDLLLICIGGKYTIDYKSANNYIEKINPKKVIPMHYKVYNSTVDIDNVDNFLHGKKYTEKYYEYEYNENDDKFIYLVAKRG